MYSRIQGEDALHKMTQAAYTHFLRGYFEKDRLLFSLTLALEVSKEERCKVCKCTRLSALPSRLSAVEDEPVKVRGSF